MKTEKMSSINHSAMRLLNGPWAFMESAFSAYVLSIISARSNTLSFTDTNINRDASRVKTYGSVAVIEIDGPIIKGISEPEASFFGVTSDESIRSDIDGVVNSGVKSIVLDFNSPGGTVLGMDETADLVSNLPKSGVSVVAFTDDLMASKAMAIAVGSMGIFATKSSIIGSVGVIATNISIEGMLEVSGIKVDVFSSGELKAAGPVKSLTEKQREDHRLTVASLAQDFFERVKASRPGVSGEVFRGGHGNGKWALTNGLIDGIVSSREQLVEMMQVK